GSSSQRRTVISRFSVDAEDPNQGNPDSEFILMQFSQPFSNHNGGMIQFASDGYLYIATGDGGSSGDPQNNAQNRATILGKILRLDVDNPSGGRNYGIPATNPFAGNSQGFREEIWVYGLRNPWRFSFDSVTNQMWAGDVGQGSWEEIDLIEKGQNYGWNCMEGTHGFPPGSNCSTTGLTLPIVEYSHSAGISVTGGYVYRGSLRPELEGAYVYADFGSGRIWLLRHENDQITADSLLLDTSIRISSFGVDENNELYIIQYPVFSEATKIFRFAGTPPTDAEEDQSTIPEKFTLEQNYPNPFNPTTIIKYHLATAGMVNLTVYNLLGQKIRSLVNAYQGRGEYQVAWYGKNDLGEQSISGIYYYQLKANSFIQTRKMILMK
ncbi:MAG: PQQ-dependent sugar dehydrogenase, partial [bacterium]